MREKYLRSVGKLLDCSSAERKRLLERLGNAVDTYLMDAPDAGETELMENFGAPEICAARLLEECDPAAMANFRQRRKRRNRILVATLAVLLALALGVAAYLWSHSGLVVIETKEYTNRPTGQVNYDYDG